jgi:hypothetical protein
MRYQTALRPDQGILMPAGAYRFSGRLFFAAIALQSFETTPRD